MSKRPEPIPILQSLAKSRRFQQKASEEIFGAGVDIGVVGRLG